MNEEEKLVIFPIPSLVSTLLRKEREKGEPLLKSEVLSIRDSASCKALTREQANCVEQERGYADIDPENCWEEWKQARIELGSLSEP